MYSLIVFDLDGTLLDTRRDLADSANELLAAFGGETLPVAAVVDMVGEGARVLVERAFAAAGLATPPADAVARFLEIYDRRLVDFTRPYPGVAEALPVLAARWPLAVLTNKPAAPAGRLLDHFGFRQYFGRIVGGDSEWPRKPAPEALLAIAGEVGVSPAATLMVGDSRVDHETACRAGTGICVARYGFGWERFPWEALVGNELFIDAPGELPGKLGRLSR
jgi:phosphoglycolate phosphatase